LIEQTASFRLDYNKFSGRFPKQSLERLFNLEVLNLGGNEFTGTIPNVFDFIHRLTHLHLNNNKFEGAIPDSLGHLSGISKFIKCSRCVVIKKKESTSHNICTLTATIRLDNNKLTGRIPNSFAMMADVEFLALNDNRLTGVIPTSLGFVDDIKYLSLKNNKLTGKIPTELAGLFRLSDLQLHGNKLTGEIPTQFGQLQAFRKFSLQQNNFVGVTMPAEICNLIDQGDMMALSADCNIPDKVTCNCCHICYPVSR
jgi:Leucine-rich repeat (LRR) protein